MMSMERREYERRAHLCKAMANPTRLLILDLLAERERSNAELLQTLKVPKANLSQHLGVLKSVNVIRVRSEGTANWISLTQSKVKEISGILESIISEQGDDEVPMIASSSESKAHGDNAASGHFH